MTFPWYDIIPVLTVFTLAIVSPGPNFILVTKVALSDSRRAGLYTAFGVACGSGLFAFAGMTGLLLLITSIPHFHALMRVLGGGYLCWLGLNMLWHWRRVAKPANTDILLPDQGLASVMAWRIGLLTNLTNPKAWAFYLSLFSLVMQPGTAVSVKILLNLAMFAISFGWYAIVVLLISDRRVQPRFLRAQPYIQAGLGCMLVLLGGRFLFG
jgi:threonine/homoserine/homoserine lactone efflux protein